jgi:hypothetical protein
MGQTPKTDAERLDEMLSGGQACIYFHTYEEDEALELVRQLAIERREDVWLWTATRGLRDGLVTQASAVPDTENPAAALFHLSQSAGKQGIFVMLDMLGYLREDRALRAFRDALRVVRATRSKLILVDHRDDLPPVVAASSARFEQSLPEEEELEAIAKETLRNCHSEQGIVLSISRQGLDTIIKNLRGLTRGQARAVIRETLGKDRRLDESDVNHVLALKRRALGHSTLLEYVEAPVTLDEIGGMSRLKFWLAQREGSFSKEAAEFGLIPPRGVLMLGVQGGGKSLAAKAVATAWKRPLLRMNVGALYDRFIGESERRLRDALKQAEAMSPVILWIDEIEKAFAGASAQSADGGLSRRMFGEMLTWMQERTAPVFVIATANDIEALPPELLRKGRFDDIFFVDLPGPEAREQIFRIHIKKRKRDPDEFELPKLVAASEGFSGAEIEQAILSALHDAYARGMELGTNLVLQAIKNSPPLSVTAAERMTALRLWAQGRCVPAD